MTPRTVSLIVLTGLIGCLGLAFLRVVQPFLLPLMLAVVTAMILQPMMRRFMSWTGNRPRLSAALTTTSLLALVMFPLLIGVLMGATQLYDWSTDLIARQADARPYAGEQTQAEIPPYEKMYQRLHVSQIAHRLQPYLDPNAKPEEFEARALNVVRQNLPKLLQNIATQTLGLAASTFGLLGSLVALSLTLSVFIAAVYFFLADGAKLLESTQCLIPVQRAHQDRLLDQFVKVTRAVVMGTFAAAVAQGLATGVGLYFAGCERVILLTVVATLVAVVPMAGTTLVWIPYAVLMCFSRENWLVPVLIFSAYNTIVVASLDNLIRSYVLNSDVKLHPLLAFISVLGGLQWIGLWGVFVGPVIASCLYALATIVNEELAAYGQLATKKDLVADVAVAVTEVTAEVSSAIEVATVAPQATVQAAPVPVKPTVVKPMQARSKTRNKRR